MPLFYGNDPQKWTYAAFNDPKLNQWDGGLAKTGAYSKCVSLELPRSGGAATQQ
ncbi:hypothetical protein BH09MYX1_BH09MYX1_41210 [soil metagenome]